MVYSIQILRGVAALLVVLHHFNQMLPWKHAGLVMFGYEGDTGVDIFFIISGFVMVYSTENPEHAKPLTFGLRRFFRVVPLAQICTLLYFILLQGTPTGNVLLRSLFFVPLAPVDPPKFGWSLVPQMWTLSYELAFYLLFGLALIFTRRFRVVVATGLILFSIVFFQALLGGPFSWQPQGVHLPATHAGILPVEVMGVLGNPLLLEFVAGMLLAWNYRRAENSFRHGARRVQARVAAGILGAAFAAIYFSAFEDGHGLLNKHGYGALCLVTAALLLEASADRPSASQLAGKRMRFFMWLGAISYPLYLVHLGIVNSIVHYFPPAVVAVVGSGVVGFLVYVALSVALAALLHVVVELPFIRLGKRWARAREVPA
ncbi:MAG: hypothetical protein JWM32_741 [Verrucomicrobia bacterium]|nr:hypothetical protein [Verrucomicrobiota bacterium]